MADDKERGQASGFEVRDHRRFDASGEARDPGAGAEGAPPPAPEPETRGESVVTFSTFLLGLSTQALLHLGEIPNPVSGTLERDLVAAKQLIDIVGVLELKTRGNLDAAERRLVESVLYDLRMRYVEIVQRESKEAT